jgi:hypothetical protein
MIARVPALFDWLVRASLAIGIAIASSSSLAPGAQPPPAARSLLDQAIEDLLRNDVPGYLRTVKRAAAAKGSSEEHFRAVTEFANASWRIEQDSADARRVLAPVLEAEFPEAFLELARMEESLGHFAAARTAALSASKFSRDHRDSLRSRTYFARFVVHEIFQVTIDRGEEVDRLRDLPTRDACTMLAPYVVDEPGMRDPSRLILFLALWTGDGKTALRAWESYFGLPADADLPPPLTSVGRTARRILPSLTDQATSDVRSQVFDSLMESRLFPEAAALASLWKIDSSSSREVKHYARWIASFGKLVDEDYRRLALGQEVVSGNQRLESSGRELWQSLNGTLAGYSVERLVNELRDRFGAVVRILPRGANYGHVIEERSLAIEQYGRKAQLRLVVLDAMVANGYVSWLSDGRAGAGGWSARITGTEPPLIVRIRGDAALSAWEAVTDPAVTRRHNAELKRGRIEDDERARQDPYAFLPGLRLRMYLAGAQRVLDHERARGLTGAALRTAFLAEYDRLWEAASIIAHEGRHALDKQTQSLPLFELEYRAKLSEIAFAPNPLIAINAIFSSDIGQKGSAHGMANQRIMRGVLGWMQARAGDIRGLDSGRPFLPQFDRLSDEQMREAFRSLDPWAQPNSR